MTVLLILALTVLGFLVVGALSLGYVSLGVVLIGAIAFFVVFRLGTALANEHDREWLPRLLPLAFAAKLIAILGRHYMVTGLYESGDSLRYHRAGEQLVSAWRTFQVPQGTGGGGGTQFTEIVTAFIYIPGVPSLLGAFMIFGILSFVGTLLFYLAFRRRLPAAGLRTYAILLFFLPSMLFWPSSVGKEALMVLALGITALGATYVFEGRYMTGSLIAVPALVFAAAIRPHVAAMVVSALVLALILAKGFGPKMTGLGRLVVLAASVIALFSLATIAATELGIDEESGGLEGFLSEQERLTGQGGSAVTGAPVQNPFDLPEATLRVLFRPLLYEAHNIAAMLSALEGTALLVLMVWKFPSLWTNIKNVRKYPYLLFALIYTAEFVVAFSSIFNLGILARQRTQVLPFFLALLIGLGWQKAHRVDLAPAATSRSDLGLTGAGLLEEPSGSTAVAPESRAP